MGYVVLFIIITVILFRIFFGTFQSFTFLLLHPIRFIKCAAADLSAAARNLKDKNIPADSGGIILIGGLFGTGKTANQVNYAISLFNSYNNVEIFSNVTLNDINYTQFEYLEQILDPVPEGRFRVFICDEFGSLFNSRNYKNCQFTEQQYITMLNQVRKERKLLLITTQRFHMLDKVFRQVAREWWECHKYWRFLLVRKYDPLDMEMNPNDVRPLSLIPTVNFLDSKITNYYDTHEIVHAFNSNVQIVDRQEASEAPVKFNNSFFKKKNKSD